MTGCLQMRTILLGLLLGCSSDGDSEAETIQPLVRATSVQVTGPMPVVMAENMVKDALPALLACWADDQPPCGTITVSHQGTRHGHKKAGGEGSLNSVEFQQCVQAIIGKIRPPTPDLDSPDSGLTVTLVYAPSTDRLEACQQ